MAIDDMKISGSKKRKRGGSINRKLLVNERVEVRSVEDGFLGSWHPGSVIQCGKQKRHVRYDNILEEDGSSYVVECVTVPPVLDGVSVDSSDSSERGLIRPIPPLFEFKGQDLSYGLCVDVSYQEAWWEGVVFDHCNGMEERKVFFPDLGDEMKIEIDQLRITQDWDEATGNWRSRGNWVLLELVQECERESIVMVSVKQIWYDVRGRKDFEKSIRDWTCNVKELWRGPVMEIIEEYYAITIEAILPALNLPKDLFEETPKLEPVEATTGNADDGSVKLYDRRTMLDLDQDSGSIAPVQEECDGGSDAQIVAVSDVSVPKEEDQVMEEEHASPIQQTTPEDENKTSSKKRFTRNMNIFWEPLVMSEAEFCPEVVDQYILGSDSKKVRELLKNKVKKHLTYLGWTIEKTEENTGAGRTRYRYRSPVAEGEKIYTSILKACKELQQDSNANSLVCQNDAAESSILHLLSDQPLTNQDSIEFVVQPEFCPEAVVKYYLYATENRHVDRRKWNLKAKQHLLAEGWILNHPTETRKRTLYKSPKNQTLGSLQGACRQYIKESIPEWTDSSMGSLSLWVVNEEERAEDFDGDDLLQCVSRLLQKEPELRETVDASPLITSTSDEKHNRSSDSKARSRKCQKHVPTRVLRSRKRVQKVLDVSYQKPQNVLSWLIDCKMVLSRSKVYCKAKGGGDTLVAEGQVSRDGIKCSCCQKMYSLGGFANHADADSNCRPSASVFLKDGRSLLDCQVQVMHDKRKKETAKKPCDNLCQGESDNICTVCQYGGELILCDQCPSAFHTSCLGLEDIPNGDWFCPSCRCGICSQIKIKGAEEGHFLTCIQCKRKYHGGCLRNRAINKSRDQKNWFCRKECEQIHSGLNKLLGKPVAVDGDNLTWTLLKYVDSENRSIDSAKNEFLIECNSQLNVALSVMHECFEPLQNPLSNSDLVEDVIFSRWSALNRTNFQGFYTVILERDEELISVATLRVHGEKVAELPLVGTRYKYRRLGMCRILMNELEKMLMQLGVERLVLPAVPDVLETWTNCFGFDKMTQFERSQFLDYTFLDFQGTTMCQKLLTKSLSPDSVITREVQPTQDDDQVFSVKCKIEFDSSASEEYQASDEAGKSKMTDLPLVEYASPLSSP